MVRHLDDGRHFLRTTERKYDLVVYALVDFLILHSGYANIRLESYLFTEQAFADIRRVLKPDGVFVMYNYYRQDGSLNALPLRPNRCSVAIRSCSACPTPETEIIRHARYRDHYQRL